MKHRPKLSPTRAAALALAAALLAGCVVTAPIKVVTTGAKAGIAAGKVGAKAATTAVDVVVPDGKDDD